MTFFLGGILLCGQTVGFFILAYPSYSYGQLTTNPYRSASFDDVIVWLLWGCSELVVLFLNHPRCCTRVSGWKLWISHLNFSLAYNEIGILRRQYCDPAGEWVSSAPFCLVYQLHILTSFRSSHSWQKKLTTIEGVGNIDSWCVLASLYEGV